MADYNEWKKLIAQKEHFSEIPVEIFAGKGRWADQFIKSILQNSEESKKLKINQLRNFFGEIRTIQRNPEIRENLQELRNAISMLEMNLAYDFGRNVINREFYNIITFTLTKVKNGDDFKKFFIFIQSLIAYHKLYSNDK